MNEQSPFDSAPDEQLGAALREALPAPFGGAFVNRVQARLRQQRPRSWDEELAGWFWQGLLASSLVAVMAGWGLKAFGRSDEVETAASASVASQLLDGATPGANVLLASMSSADTP
ncbi:MAG TPA: hypothetical protein VGI92_04320 [Gemmatimonadales bacterium]